MDGRTTFVIMLVIIMSWLVMVQNAPVDRKVLTCYWPDCREVRVNVTEVREVFVTSCRLNLVVVFGDPTMIKIRDLHGHICEATFSPTAPKHTTIGQTETSTTIFSSTIVPATDTHSEPTQVSSGTAETTSNVVVTTPKLTKSGQTETSSTTIFSSTIVPPTDTHSEPTLVSSGTAETTSNVSVTTPKLTKSGQTETSTTIFSSTIVPATDTHSEPTQVSSGTAETTSTVTAEVTTVGIAVQTESGQNILKKLLESLNKPLEDGETLTDKSLGFLAWAVATTFTVAMLLLKKWLKKKCENLMKDDNVSTPPPIR